MNYLPRTKDGADTIFLRDKNRITHNKFRILDNKSIMGEFYCTAFIEYMLGAKALLYYY